MKRSDNATSVLKSIRGKQVGTAQGTSNSSVHDSYSLEMSHSLQHFLTQNTLPVATTPRCEMRLAKSNACTGRGIPTENPHTHPACKQKRCCELSGPQRHPREYHFLLFGSVVRRGGRFGCYAACMSVVPTTKMSKRTQVTSYGCQRRVFF